MNQYLQLVDEFHKAFCYRQPTPTTPCVADHETNLLRLTLIKEEMDELRSALCGHDAKETLDALCDLQYVLSGAILALGFKDVFDAAFAEVHRSNMSKLWTDEEADRYCKTGLLDKEVLDFKKTGDRFIAQRADKKIIKSPSYSPANLAQFV